MECLNCKKDLKHTPGKRKKQFCNPNCRVTYWQKNKPSKLKENSPLIKELKERIKYLAQGKIEVEQELGRVMEDNIGLLAKNAALEAKLAEKTGSCNLNDINNITSALENGKKKPNTALKDKKATDVPPKENRGGNGAGNDSVNYMNHYEQAPYDTPPLGRVQDEPDWQKGVKEAGIEEEPPEGLSEIQKMVWKNDQKRKNNPKAAPITGFGLTKKQKS